MASDKDTNVPCKLIPEHYVVTPEMMHSIELCLYCVAYPMYDIADTDQKRAQELLEVIDNAKAP